MKPTPLPYAQSLAYANALYESSARDLSGSTPTESLYESYLRRKYNRVAMLARQSLRLAGQLNRPISRRKRQSEPCADLD